MNEDQLVQACIEGNYRAQKALYQTYAAQMFGVCLRYAGTREEAEETLQEGFIKAFRKLETYEGRGALGAWLRRIMVNTALQRLRDQRKMNFMVALDDVHDLTEVSDSVLNKLHTDELLALVQRLPEGFRAVFNLYAVEGYSHAEIGEILNINEGTSKSQYSRCRSLLRKWLTQSEINERAI